jgi:hypothetical protein
VTTGRRRNPVTNRAPSRHSDARSPVSYVRRARSLRGRLRREPAKLHQALRELNAQRPAPPTPAAAPVSSEQAFYAAADAAFDGATLRYSQRLSLLMLSHALEIPRFRANLIIATVQHARRADVTPTPARGWILPISLGVVLQATILIAAAFLLRP